MRFGRYSPAMDSDVRAGRFVPTLPAMIIEQENIMIRRVGAAAWRQVAEVCLLQEGIISIERGGSVTQFPSISVS